MVCFEIYVCIYVGVQSKCRVRVPGGSRIKLDDSFMQSRLNDKINTKCEDGKHEQNN